MQPFTDRAKRAVEAVNLHWQANGRECVGKWIAIRLSDGSSDLTLYDTKADAVRHQLWENQCAYHRLLPDGAQETSMERFLAFNEQLYDAGARLQDPDQQVPMPLLPENQRAVIEAVRRSR